MAKTHFKKAFNSPYLGSQDLPDYKDINLTIERVVLQGSKGLKDDGNFNIAYFTDVKVKPMLLNATNSKRLAKLADSVYIEDWVNIEVTIMVQTGIVAFGGVHDALRIREVTRVTEKSKPQLKETSKKWSELVLKVIDGTERTIIEKYYSVSDEIWDKIVAEGEQIMRDLEESQKSDAQKKAQAAADAKKKTEDKIDKFLDQKENE